MSAQAARVRAPSPREEWTREEQTREERAREEWQDEPAPEPRRSRAHLRVAPPPPVSAPRTPFVVLVLLVVVGGVLGILVLNTKTNESAFHLHELREQQAILDQRQQELEQRIAEANSTAQLTAAARRLGLVQVPPGELGRIRVSSGEVVGEPVPVADEPGGTGEG